MALLGRVGAKGCRSMLSGFSKGLFCGVLQPGWLQGRIGAKRHFLTEDVIKLRAFQRQKLIEARNLTGSEENPIELFKQKMQQHKLILQKDLKLLLHLCETPEDMQTAREAIYRYHTQNPNLLDRDYRFGPLFMRLCYELGLEEMAAATITDKNMKGFFTTIAFNIAINMLFIKGSYESAMDVIRTMRNQGVAFNKDTVLLATGTCYKLNTADSYRSCIDLLEEQQTKGGDLISRRAWCFAVALALKQNNFEKAQLLVLQIFCLHNNICLNLKLIILAMSGKISEAVSLLSTSLYPESPFFVKKPEITQEAVDFLRLQANGGQLQMEVEQIVAQLEQAGQVTDETLDHMLCQTPRVQRKLVLMEERRKINQRTSRSLQCTLFPE